MSNLENPICTQISDVENYEYTELHKVKKYSRNWLGFSKVHYEKKFTKNIRPTDI